jgi:G:T/U-mismatch repair DNA glycosylase
VESGTNISSITFGGNSFLTHRSLTNLSTDRQLVNSLVNSSTDRQLINSQAHSSTDRQLVNSLANSSTDRKLVNSLAHSSTDRRNWSTHGHIRRRTDNVNLNDHGLGLGKNTFLYFRHFRRKKYKKYKGKIQKGVTSTFIDHNSINFGRMTIEQLLCEVESYYLSKTLK